MIFTTLLLTELYIRPTGTVFHMMTWGTATLLTLLKKNLAESEKPLKKFQECQCETIKSKLNKVFETQELILSIFFLFGYKVFRLIIRSIMCIVILAVYTLALVPTLKSIFPVYTTISCTFSFTRIHTQFSKGNGAGDLSVRIGKYASPELSQLYFNGDRRIRRVAKDRRRASVTQ